MTSTHPEERRIAGLLRELIARGGVPVAQLEERLGWERGRLQEALDGERDLTFALVVQVLPLLRLSPAEFFSQAYGLREDGRSPSGDEDGLDRRFLESRRVIEEAIARRNAWRRERRDA